ncbi:A24 family peptidase [Novipirellula artificiosorum]|uniref:Leader peptidase PppA n=1 Tax=Novipirellula artificiosorum TaxID=2528016 RepID=A0A5C6DR76_9BACT|nr:prepilin peptidase [Novipirellula artificiosorum]TWU37259.1 Leader peptidase PppA [Novipirellula artificiosorum]
MTRRRRPIPWALLLLATISLLCLAYIFGLAWLQAKHWPMVTPADLYMTRLVDVTIFLWLFWVGSSIGSFLNVVAWRMPRGESVNGRSYCPRCKHQLKARDNFPVFGWLALRGRCRTCRLPISPRYPIVEAAVGISLTLVGLAEIYRLGLPFQSSHGHGGPLWTPLVSTTTLAVLFYHTLAISFSWAMGLIRMDRQQLPRKLAITSLAVLTIGMLAYPAVMIVPWQTRVPEFWRGDGLRVDALMRILTAFAAATFYARALGKGLCRDADLKLDPLGQSTARLFDLIAILSVPAIIVGWQAVAGVLIVASVLSILLRPILTLPTDMLGRFAVAIPIALSLHLAFWRQLDGLWFWPSCDSSPGVILVAGAIVLVSPVWLREPVANERGGAVFNPDGEGEVDKRTPSSDPEGNSQNHSSEKTIPKN